MPTTTLPPKDKDAANEQLPLPTFQKLLTRDEVAKIFSIDKMTVYKYVENGTLPKPIKVGERGSRWPANEIQTIVDARCAGAKGEEVIKIVDRIHANRKARLDAIREAA